MTSPSSFLHTPYYCEENVWQLCGHERLAGAEARVLFVSNARRGCALWSQRAAKEPGQAVVWDYHVLLVVRGVGGWRVWDLDSTLGLDLPLAVYLEATFLPLPEQLLRYRPMFRLLPAPSYRAAFSSDRSHMRDAEGGWIHPPPSWPAIVRRDAPSFLRWTTMEPGDDDVLDRRRLVALLQRGAP